ncbi:MAG TPA: HAMP domain-containing histidine kinase, partial [Candidatus Aphodomonas merdavium]|nr:HAMP domain-containing histidine kinase [Candidatus Aphodomonas merdavium]
MAEGELSILENEIAKMTLRIREQNRALQGEKQRLADALADISHQLRTPLTAANLILPLVEKAPEAKARKALLREMEELFLQMEWLLDALLKLSRLDAGIVPLKKEAVEVAALVRAAAHPLLIPLELHEIALRCSVPEGMRIVADAGWLSQALENILKNCIQSAPRQSAIEIAARETPLFSEIVIRDQGKGFSAEDLPRVFERFYRGKGSETVGYGIGLALSKMIILRHGGSICAQNAPQGGAEFIIRFPK